MVDTDSSILAVVEDVLSKLDLKIKRLTAVDNGEHKNEIQFLKHLQCNFIRLADYRDQIIQLVPFIQKEIEASWDHVTDQKFEFEKKKKELEELKKEVALTQAEENNLQIEKKNLSKQLRSEESDLIRNQKQFNKKGKQIEKLHSELETISKLELEANPEDTFITKIFKSKNKIEAKRLSRRITDQYVEADNLSVKIQENQAQISQASEDIDYQQKRLKSLQVENINLRQKLDEILNTMKENLSEIQQTEKDLTQSKQDLKNLSIALVEVANRTMQQNSLYQKSIVSPLDDIDYQSFLQESTSFSLAEEIENLLTSRNALLEQSDNSD